MKDVENLIKMLIAINDRYSMYINVLILERKYLLENNNDLFSKNLKEKISISKDIEFMDEKISEIVASIGKKFSFSSLSDLADAIKNDDLKTELIYLKDKLKNTMQKVRRENKVNDSLLKEKNNFVSSVINELNKSDNIYSSNGKNRPITGKGIIDRKV